MPKRNATVRKKDAGQLLVMAVVSIAVFLAFLGLVLDVARLFVVRQQLRNACDAAATAGVVELPSSPANCRTHALSYYLANRAGAVVGSPVVVGGGHVYTLSNGDVLTITTPHPAGGSDAESASRVRVSARREVESLFMGLVGVRFLPVSAFAVAIRGGGRSPITAFAGGISNGATQPLAYTRTDGRRYALVVVGNNVRFGYDATGVLAGWIASGQNVYLRSNNGEGQAMFLGTGFANDIRGNNLTSLLQNPIAATIPPAPFIDPAYYIQQASNSGARHTGNTSLSGNDRTYGDITVINGNLTISGNNLRLGRIHVNGGNLTIDGNNITFTNFIYATGNILYSGNNGSGRVTFAAGGHVRLETNNAVLTPADTQNNLLAYAGADATLGGNAYFSSPRFNPANFYIRMNDNNMHTSGTLYAPYGYAHLDGNNINIGGSVIADSIAIVGNNVEIRFNPQFSPPAITESALRSALVE